jgi:hypothetical protein
MNHAGIRLPSVLAVALTAIAVAQAAPPAPAGAASVAAPARPLADACPAQLPVRQTVSETLDGWTPLDQQGNYPFVRVAFYPGPPAESSLIVPTAEFKGQAGLHDRWDLPPHKGSYWMTCSYANTTATVARKLADDTDFYQADYDGRFLTLVVKHWSCGVKRTMPQPVWTTKPQPKPVKPATKATPGQRTN